MRVGKLRHWGAIEQVTETQDADSAVLEADFLMQSFMLRWNPYWIVAVSLVLLMLSFCGMVFQ